MATKVSHSLEQHFCQSIGINGGVSNNDILRKRMAILATKINRKVVLPLGSHNGDNAAMIAFAADINHSSLNLL
jgi:tRNA A37 threonylcarbamoyltransferase TsaD